MEEKNRNQIHLHATLGKSFTPLAMALFHPYVEKATIYVDDKERGISFQQAIFAYSWGRSETMVAPEIQIVTVPKISESASNSLIEILGQLVENLNAKEYTITENDVLFFSGTAAHLLMLSEVLGFRRLLVVKLDEDTNRGKLVEIGTGEDLVLEHEVEFSLEEMVKLYGTSLGELEELAPKHNGKKFIQSIKLVGSQIHFTYNPKADFGPGGARRRFCLFVLECEGIFGRYGIRHITEDAMLNEWLKNTSHPYSLLGVNS